MQYTTTRVLFILLGLTLVMCLALMLLNNTHKTTLLEGFDTTIPYKIPDDPVINAIQSQLASESPDQLKSTINALQTRLIDYGYAPNLNSYVKKTELDSSKCTVSRAEDRDKYIYKSALPLPGPRIDLSEYVKKTSIPPEKVCPTLPDVDMSKYVLKSTLPPNQQCPSCIAPKVKVSAGLCRECPPAPTCPPPQACPILKCPEPKPCVQKDCPKCDEIRYIKVPAVITKTVDAPSATTAPNQRGYFDRIFTQNNSSLNDSALQNNAMIQKRLRDDEISRTLANETTALNTNPMTTNAGACILNDSMPVTTMPCANTQIFVPNPDLNSDFKRYGIYGPPENPMWL